MARRPDSPALTALLCAIALSLAGPAPAADAALASPRSPSAHSARHRQHKPVRHRKHRHAAVSPVALDAATPAIATPGGPTAAAAGAPGGSSPEVAVPGTCTGADLIPSADNLDAVRGAVLCLVNQQRRAHGIAPLRENAPLDAAAARHSAEMVSQNYFDHVGLDGTGVVARELAAGFVAAATLNVGENLASATGALAAPAATVTGWMDSPGHRDNILNAAFTDTGLGVVAAVPALLGSAAGATYTQCFGAAG